ncbi:hypothetical protein Ssi03_73880 [Sphaerisporangium siamense]|nr:hypothetical protein Ssi03_73880 [Sphaerisporangium siamense]
MAGAPGTAGVAGVPVVPGTPGMAGTPVVIPMPGAAGMAGAADAGGIPVPCVVGAPCPVPGTGGSTGGKAGSVPPGRVWSSSDSREGLSGKRSPGGPPAVLGIVWSGFGMAGDAGEGPAAAWPVPGQGGVLGVREAGVSSRGSDGPNQSCSPGNRSAAGHGCASPRPHARRVPPAGA